jgi:hypothetical protein
MKLVIRALDNMGDLQYEAEVEDLPDEMFTPLGSTEITLASVKAALDWHLAEQAKGER